MSKATLKLEYAGLGDVTDKTLLRNAAANRPTMTRFKHIVRLVLSKLAAAAVMAVILSGQARADWPDRPITIIVPFAAGGTTDLLGRLLAAKLSERLGRSVRVENTVGAAGRDGLRAAAAAAANGYTLLVLTNAALISGLIDPRLSETSYDTLKDFVPIAYLGGAPNIIVTRPSSGIGSVAEFIAKAKANPGKLTYASPGLGTSAELAVELLRQRMNIKIEHVPFFGSEPSLMAATSGATDIAAIGIGGLMDHFRSGEIKGLVQTGRERWPDLPDVPTMAEAGIPDAVVETSQMFVAPSATPGPIIDKLTEETQQIMQQPGVKAEMLKAGFLVQYEGPGEMRARITREIPMWKELVRRAGFKIR
jgi:tripartite-type tricarboxylate transporter receptor subunit TctC